MLTSSTRTAAARQVAPSTSRRTLPLGALAVILLIVCIGVLGAVALSLKLYIPALLLFAMAAGLTMARQVTEQLRLANLRTEEMTQELRLIRHSLTVRSVSPGAGEVPAGQYPLTPPTDIGHFPR